MKRLLHCLSVLAVACSAFFMISAERLPLASVDANKMTSALQGSTSSKSGMNLVWWIPTEFWSASLLSNKDLPPGAAQQLITALEPYAMLAVVRGDIADPPTFYDQRTVTANLVVTYTDAAGKSITLKPNDNPNATVVQLLTQMKPLLTAAMGKAGENMHFYIFDDKDAAGKRVVSPYDAGQLVIELKPLPKDSGGKVFFDMPLDPLFKPRLCGSCERQANVAWKFCPFCGKGLAN